VTRTPPPGRELKMSRPENPIDVVPPEPDPLLNLNDVVVLLRGKAKRSSVYKWAQSGELPGAFKIGSRIWVRRHVLEAWLAGEA
jgi:predicted DNA-binding transcriptional regulator AlpA